jgi:hypothetical protein
MGTGSRTGEPVSRYRVPRIPDPVVGNVRGCGGARWNRKGDKKTRKKNYFATAIYIQVCTYEAPDSGHWHSPCLLAI